MKATFSLLALSTLFAFGCTHQKYAETRFHLGAISAPCMGKTWDDCKIAKDLESINTECTDKKDIDGPCDAGVTLLQDLFGDTQQQKFANYIVYFDQDHTPGSFVRKQPVLMWNNKNTHYLYGVQEVYLLLFTQYKACFTAHGTTLAKSEPNPFDAVLKILGKTLTSADSPPALHIAEAQFTWYPLSGNADKPLGWLAVGAVPVDVNTTDWITVRYMQPKPKTDKTTLPDECVLEAGQTAPTYNGSFLAHNVFFSNSRESRIGVAVAFGSTFTGGQAAPKSDVTSNPYLNGYALAKVYLPGLRPALISDPHTTGGSVKYHRSLGLVVGTNITNSPFSELVFGISVGHLLGNVGLIGGVNSFVAATSSSSTTTEVSHRRRRPFLGIEYSF